MTPSYVPVPVDDPPPVGHLLRPPPLLLSQQQQQPMEHRDFPPPLTEEKFMELFMLFSHATGIRLNERDFNIEGRQVNPWSLHRAVFARNGFDSVTAKGEWPLIGAALGLPSPPPVSFSSWGDPSHDQLTYCAPPAVAYRLQQLYQDSLRHFDQVYISSSAVLRSRNQSDQVIVNGPQPPQQQATELSPQPQPTEAHRQTLLAHVPSESALGVPQHATAFVEQNAQPVNLAPTSGVQVAAHSSLQSTQSHMQQQQKEALRMKVVQSVTTPQQAQERHAIMQAPQSHAFPERSVPWQLSINNQISPLQHVIRAQDPPHAHQFSTFIPQDQQQQQNDSGFVSCAGQNFIPPGVGFPQGHAPLQQGFVQPCPGQQVTNLPGNFADLSLSQLRGLHAQMRHIVIEGEKNLRTSSATGGEGDIQRQQLRAKLDCYQKRLPVLREIIDSKTRETSSWHRSPSIDVDLLFNGTLAQVAGAPPKHSPQIIQSFSSQQPNQLNELPPFSEERFKSVLLYFTAYTGFGLCERDFTIEGKPVSPLALHKAVFLRNGFESVCTYNEWPIIGAVLGYPPSSGVEACQPIQCGLEVAHRLQQLYNDTLRHFDQAYINSIVPLLRDLQTSDQVPFQSSQPLGQLYQPTEANYEALLANVISDLSLLTAEVMSTLPQFWSKSRVEFGAHRVLQRVIESLVQNRTYWQVSLRVIIDPSLQSIQDPLQRQRSRQRAIVCGIAHNIVQLTAKGRGQPSDTMMASSTTIGLSNTPLAGTVEKRRLSMEEIAIAKRWVHEQKRIAFARNFDGAAAGSHAPIPESDIPEYRRNLERLDQALCKIEKYIHVAFAFLKKEDVVQRMLTMMASVRAQLDELEKPNPRYMLELHTIRGMIQEADNMNKGLKTILVYGTQCPMMVPGGVLSAPQLPPRPHCVGMPPPLFAQPATVTPAMSQVDHEPTPSSGRAMSDWEDLFGEEVRIAMDKLRI